MARPTPKPAGGDGCRRWRWWVLLLWAGTPVTGLPAPVGDLPEPLTLAAALARADGAHPALEAARAARDLAEAQVLEARAALRPQVFLEWSPRVVDPAADPGRQGEDDSVARLTLRQRLYDFGASRAARRAAGAGRLARDLELFDARQRHRLAIMRAFFDVLLADLRYEVDNQFMAFRFVRFDHARDRQRLGEVSSVDVKELEHRYQQALVRRTESEKRQAETRFRLAALLNVPDRPPAELVAPALPGNDRIPPEFESLWKQVAAAEPRLRALRREVAAAEAAVEAARALRRPVLEAELEAADYARSTTSRNAAIAGLNLRIPLYQGGTARAALAAARARLRARRAELRRAEYDLRQTVLALVQRLESLQVARRAARVQLDYQELNLDRARSQYDLEIRSTLGDAMTRLSEAQWNAARVEYELAMAWAQVDALRGRLAQPVEDKP